MTKTFCDRCGKEITKRGVYAWLTHRCYYATLRMIGSGSDDTTHVSDDKYICQNVRKATLNPEPPKESA